LRPRRERTLQQKRQYIRVLDTPAAVDTYMQGRDCENYLYITGPTWVAVGLVREVATDLVEAGGELCQGQTTWWPDGRVCGDCWREHDLCVVALTGMSDVHFHTKRTILASVVKTGFDLRKQLPLLSNR
jgi:hypothetical protein